MFVLTVLLLETLPSAVAGLTREAAAYRLAGSPTMVLSNWNATPPAARHT